MSKKTNFGKTLSGIEFSILLAIIIVMAFTPVGFIKAGPLTITLLMVPVIVAALTLTPLAAGGLGLVFGICSFIQCFTGDPFGAALVSSSIWKTFLVCVPTRFLAGFFTGLIFKAISKKTKKDALSFTISAISGSLLNTILFLGTLALLFFKTNFTAEQSAAFGGGNSIIPTVIAIATGINAPIEAVVCAVLGSAIGKALKLAFKNIDKLKINTKSC
ncbi:MAG: ECF transporter S component [Candidatus Fimenecus sp.]